tara:strand:- start:1205 stop:1312 length:108 start_codon:yes stop_codon:yes gene_type:complete
MALSFGKRAGMVRSIGKRAEERAVAAFSSYRERGN